MSIDKSELTIYNMTYIMNKRAKKILYLKDKKKMSFRQIGPELGISHQRANQIYLITKLHMQLRPKRKSKVGG